MVRITCIQSDGREEVLDVESGTSVMQAIMSNDVPGLIAECGGACSCATCHVYLDDRWVDKVPVKGDGEDAMLEAACDLKANSRLSCQVAVTPELDGLIVHIPRTQT